MDASPLHVEFGLTSPDPTKILDTAASAAASHADLSTRFSEALDPPCLVTFEGSARGLHFENVDMVFVVGRPSSASSYLHISGRVGRHSAANGVGSVNPGTVVSICTAGTARELEGWIEQLGATDFSALEVSSEPPIIETTAPEESAV